MSVVILGGNECMERRYREVCKEYGYNSKIFIHPVGSLKNKLGSPDLMIFFTGAMSHKMVNAARAELKGYDTKFAYAHSSSISTLKSVLEEHKLASQPA